MAAAVAQDLAAKVPVGVFRVQVGRDADCLALLRALADALGVADTDFVSIPKARDRCRRRFAGERTLVVLDDCLWTPRRWTFVDFPGRQFLISRSAGLLPASSSP